MTEQNLLWVWFIDDIEYELVYIFFLRCTKNTIGNIVWLESMNSIIDIWIKNTWPFTYIYKFLFAMRFIIQIKSEWNIFRWQREKKLTAKQYKKNILWIHIICNYANDIELSPGTTHILRNNKFQIWNQ